MTAKTPVLAGLLAAAIVLPAWAWATPASVDRGQRLAQANCARCHTIVGTRPSPNADAPPFPALQTIFPGRSIDEIFADSMLADHPGMPFFLGRPDERQDLLDYIRRAQPAPDQIGRAPRAF